MSALTSGQRLPCGCVVGFYWCGRHDAGAVRDTPTCTWAFNFGGEGFRMKTLPANSLVHAADQERISSMRCPTEYPDTEPHCRCHINPPCSFCTSKTEEE